jgi:hypothetical protein
MGQTGNPTLFSGRACSSRRILKEFGSAMPIAQAAADPRGEEGFPGGPVRRCVIRSASTGQTRQQEYMNAMDGAGAQLSGRRRRERGCEAVLAGPCTGACRLGGSPMGPNGPWLADGEHVWTPLNGSKGGRCSLSAPARGQTWRCASHHPNLDLELPTTQRLPILARVRSCLLHRVLYVNGPSMGRIEIEGRRGARGHPSAPSAVTRRRRARRRAPRRRPARGPRGSSG